MTYARTLAASIITILLVAVPMPVTEAVEVATATSTAPDGTPRRMPTPALAETTEPALPDPHVPIVNSDDEALVELAEWALERYETAGLELPALDIFFHPDREPCKENRGIFNGDLMRVDVCVDEPLVILHELAHAWTHVHIEPVEEAAFVTAGGFESWNDPETAWSDRGMEDAAETIAWALLEHPIQMPTSGGPIAERNAAYRLLTGSDAPRLVSQN